MNERAQRLDGLLEPLLWVAALLVIPEVILEATSEAGGWATLATGLNWGVWITFTVALVATTAVADSRWRWLRGRPLDLAIVVLTPPFAPAALLGLRLARLLRVLRLLRLARTAGLTRRALSLEGVKWAAATAGLVALAGGAAFADVEHRSTADGLWWAATTMTTVGYGDVSPTTGAGKVIGVAVMLIGIGFVAFLTAAIAQRFVAQIEEPKPAWENAVLSDLDEIKTRLAAIEKHIHAG